MKISPLACNCCDDLIMYARQVSALGRVVENLATVDSDCLEDIGQEIGYLLTDLSKLLEAELGALYYPIEAAYDNAARDSNRGAGEGIAHKPAGLDWMQANPIRKEDLTSKG